MEVPRKWEVLRDWQWRNDRGQMAKDDQREKEKIDEAQRADDAKEQALRQRRRSAALATLAARVRQLDA